MLIITALVSKRNARSEGALAAETPTVDLQFAPAPAGAAPAGAATAEDKFDGEKVTVGVVKK